MRSLRGTTLSVAVLFGVFLIGSALGCALAFFGQPGSGLRIYLSDYFLTISRDAVSTSLLTALFNSIRWPLIIFVAAFTPFAAALIPALLLLRGFLLTYAATCLSILFNRSGWITASILLAVPLALELPALFVLSCEGVYGGKSKPPLSDSEHRRYLRTEILLVEGSFLVVAVATQTTIIPALFSAVCSRFFT